MADLDDFFAKKGKKKKKKPMVQVLNDVDPTPPKQEEEKLQPLVTTTVPEDSEWLESKMSTVEINPDDIHGVTVLNDEESKEFSEDKTEPVVESLEEDTKIVNRNPVASPWQPVTTPQSQQEPEQVKTDSTSVTSLAKDGRYVPPSLRREIRRPHSNHGPPDISSTKAFPSLQTATKGDEPQAPPVMKDYTELPLQNKFSALATD